MTGVVVTAAGSSLRMGGQKKEFRLSGIPDGDGTELSVLGAAVRPFFDHPQISAIIITVPEGAAPRAREVLPPRFFTPGAKPIAFIAGGSTRRASIQRALEALRGYAIDRVLIHDGARPWVSGELIQRVLTALTTHEAVIPVLPLSETPKEIDSKGIIVRHLVRARTVAAQTPQGFAFREILDAHREEALRIEKGGEDDCTDDAEVWSRYSGIVQVVPGTPENRKITFPQDLPL